MDRLPWSRFHWLVIVGLGVSWILDGLEIQIVSQAGYQDSLGLSNGEVGAVGSVYLAGEVAGALVFGRITDRWGRRKLFMITLGVYLVASGLAGFSWDLWSLLVLRFIAGTGIGGEYTAINSAIDELIPSHYRGRVDIAINGTYWGGAAIGAAANLYLLSDQVPQNVGWRIGFLIGPAIGIAIIVLRRHIPESPRWLMTHGRQSEAEQVVEDIEARVRADGTRLPEVPDSRAIAIIPEKSISYRQMAKVFFGKYPRRSILGFSMMVTQAFLYNAIFFTYALVLTNFFHVAQGHTAYYFIAFAIGNLLGPIVLGPLFDTVGRRVMISGTYIVASVLLVVTAVLFDKGMLNATTQTGCWVVIFFLASAGASAAYLTVSEIFPLELRAQAIAVFFAIAQGFGALGPTIYGGFVASKKPSELMIGYFLGAGVMAVGGIVEAVIGVKAERTSLEDIANPLSVVRKPVDGILSGIRNAVPETGPQVRPAGTT